MNKKENCSATTMWRFRGKLIKTERRGCNGRERETRVLGVYSYYLIFKFLNY